MARATPCIITPKCDRDEIPEESTISYHLATTNVYRSTVLINPYDLRRKTIRKRIVAKDIEAFHQNGYFARFIRLKYVRILNRVLCHDKTREKNMERSR